MYIILLDEHIYHDKPCYWYYSHMRNCRYILKVSRESVNNLSLEINKLTIIVLLVVHRMGNCLRRMNSMLLSGKWECVIEWVWLVTCERCPKWQIICLSQQRVASARMSHMYVHISCILYSVQFFLIYFTLHPVMYFTHRSEPWKSCGMLFG